MKQKVSDKSKEKRNIPREKGKSDHISIKESKLDKLRGESILEKIFGGKEAPPVKKSEKKIKDFDKKMEALAKATGGVWKGGKSEVPLSQASSSVIEKNDKKKFVVPVKKEANLSTAFKIVIPTDILDKLPLAISDVGAESRMAFRNISKVKSSQNTKARERNSKRNTRKQGVKSKTETSIDGEHLNQVDKTAPNIHLGKRDLTHELSTCSEIEQPSLEILESDHKSFKVSDEPLNAGLLGEQISPIELVEITAEAVVSKPEPQKPWSQSNLECNELINSDALTRLEAVKPAGNSSIEKPGAELDISLDELILTEARSPQTPKSTRVRTLILPTPVQLRIGGGQWGHAKPPSSETGSTKPSTAKQSVTEGKSWVATSSERVFSVSESFVAPGTAEWRAPCGASPERKREPPSRIKAISKNKKTGTARPGRALREPQTHKGHDRFRGILESVHTDTGGPQSGDKEHTGPEERDKPFPCFLSSSTLQPAEVFDFARPTPSTTGTHEIPTDLPKPPRTDLARPVDTTKVAECPLRQSILRDCRVCPLDGSALSPPGPRLSALLGLSKLPLTPPRWSSPALRQYAHSQHRVWTECPTFAVLQNFLPPLSQSTQSGTMESLHPDNSKVQLSFDVWETGCGGQREWNFSLVTTLRSSPTNLRKLDLHNLHYACWHGGESEPLFDRQLPRTKQLLRVWKLADGPVTLFKVDFNDLAIRDVQWSLCRLSTNKGRLFASGSHTTLDSCTQQLPDFQACWAVSPPSSEFTESIGGGIQLLPSSILISLAADESRLVGDSTAQPEAIPVAVASQSLRQRLDFIYNLFN